MRARNPKNVKVGMVIVCRDEVDIIRENLYFHFGCGVSEFVVVDNASTDGTRELVAQVATELPIQIIDESSNDRVMNQWATNACISLIERGCNWIIPNDADEFWWTESLDLPAVLANRTGKLLCGRANLFPLRETLEQGLDFLTYEIRPASHAWKINAEICLQPDCPNLPVMWGPIGRKVLFDTEGFVAVADGNHDVTTRTERPTEMANDLFVWHYPLRGYGQLESKVKKHGAELERNDYSQTYKDWHLRYLLKKYRDGALRDLYDSMVVNATRAKALEKEGLLTVDATMAQLRLARPELFGYPLAVSGEPAQRAAGA